MLGNPDKLLAMFPITKKTRDEREFIFTPHDFERIRKLIYDHAGIALSPKKTDMVYSRLARRLRENGLSTFKDYLALLEDNDEHEWGVFVNSLTTNLTSFFREPHHFPLLAEHVEHVTKHRNRPNRPITLWCSACSTGEEPYSMAMTMVELFDSYTPPVKILATDLDTNVLAKAKEGVYHMDRLEKLPADKLKRFFLKGGDARTGQARIRQELRNMVTFQRLNLLDNDWPMRTLFDAIFCRNVMIYFDKLTQHKILKKFAPMLQPDGLLFVGHSESLFRASDLFKLRGKTVYELAHKANPRASR